MSYEPRPQLKVLRILVALFCAAVFLSACTPITTGNTMTGSSGPSDPATVKAQVEQLLQHTRRENGVNSSILSQTSNPVDLEASVNVVKAFWESKGFTTRTETNPQNPGLLRLYADEIGGHLSFFYANIRGSGVKMESVCIAGDQTAIYKELDKEEASSSPSPTTT